MKSAYGSAHGVQRVSFPSPGTAYLHGLYVNPKFRGLGEGKSILSEVMADADRDGIVLSLHTRPDLVPFFEKFGFQAQEEQKYGLYMTRQPKLKEAVDDIDVKGDMFEGVDDEMKGLIRGIKRSTPQFVEDFMNEHFPWDESYEMWELGGFYNFGGSLADRANCAYFEKKYPGLITTEYGGLGSETVGIKKADLKKLDADTLESLAADLTAIQDNVVIDDDIYSELESDLRQEAWENWVAWDFVRALVARFPEHEELLWEYKSDPLMRALFEDARERAGEEWFEENDRGGDQYVRIDPVIQAVSDAMIREWLMGIGEGLKSKPEKKFSCVMAPASPELTDAVIRWGKMFITDDKLYRDEKDPDGFGREHEIHVTVKFGLHEAEPSDELLSIIEETQPFEIEVAPCSLFENPEFDVVKFDCDGEALRALNAKISQLKNSDAHPEYHPHMTCAYVVKGSCLNLVGTPLLGEGDEARLRFTVKSVLFSGAQKLRLFLGKPNIEHISSSYTRENRATTCNA
jgi:2'-5' RNA ligase